VSGVYASTCLTSADPLALADEMRRLMRDYPVRRSKVPITSAGVVETSTLESI